MFLIKKRANNISCYTNCLQYLQTLCIGSCNDWNKHFLLKWYRFREVIDPFRQCNSCNTFLTLRAKARCYLALQTNTCPGSSWLASSLSMNESLVFFQLYSLQWNNNKMKNCLSVQGIMNRTQFFYNIFKEISIHGYKKCCVWRRKEKTDQAAKQIPISFYT